MTDIYETVSACYVNQGGKRRGAFAIYLEPWHADVYDFLDLRKKLDPKRVDVVIYLLVYGFPICLWKA